MIEVFSASSPEEQLKQETQQELSALKNQINDYDELTNDLLKHAIESYDGSGTLDLSNMHITDDDLFLASSKLSTLKGLRVIDLSHNSLEKLGTYTAPVFQDCLKLEEIDFSYNRIIEFDGKYLDPRTAAGIKRIYLDHNSYSEDSYTYACDTIRNLSVFKSLKRFSAQGNNLTSKSFLNSRNKLNSLEECYLSDNHILDCSRLSTFPGLQYLDISENDFFKLSLLTGNYKDFSGSVLTPAGASFKGISKSKLKKLYLDKLIVDDLTYLADKIDGGEELLRMKNKKGLQIEAPK